MAAAPYSVAGKVALVTGAERGIGWETARLLHSRGASVALVDLAEDATKAAAQRSAGDDRVIGIGADVTDRDAMEAAVEETVEAFGGLDIVVANAGIAPPTATMRVIDEEAFERTIEIDLLGVWRTVRGPAPDRRAPRPRRRRGVGVRLLQRSAQRVLRHEQGGRRAARPGAASRACAARRERERRLLRVHRHPDGAGRLQGPDRAQLRGGPAEVPAAAPAPERRGRGDRRRHRPARAAIIAPKWWAVWSVLRGIFNPLFDARALRDPRLQAVVREADRPERSQLTQGTAPPAP